MLSIIGLIVLSLILMGLVGYVYLNYKASQNPIFHALDKYLEDSHREVAEIINKPRKKSKFLEEYDKYLNLDHI